MKKLIIKLGISKYEDRQKIISALTENQYKAWVDVHSHVGCFEDDDRYVCFEIDESELSKDNG